MMITNAPSIILSLPCKGCCRRVGHEAGWTHCLQVHLSRWDLFHAHAFRSWRDGKLGLLFHAKEYPQECEAFPYNLGFCQHGSGLAYATREMNFRNLLFFEVHQPGGLSGWGKSYLDDLMQHHKDSMGHNFMFHDTPGCIGLCRSGHGAFRHLLLLTGRAALCTMSDM